MDRSVGLINMNARLYDPVLGRFISADETIDNPLDMQTFNRFTYAENNPLRNVDLAECMSGSRVLSLFLVDVGA